MTLLIRPIAALWPDGSGGVTVTYIHTDHLNTPRAITRTTDSAVLWRWRSDPFGTDQAEEDVDGDSVLARYYPRFPGQIYDFSSGLNYNYFRDYDPTTGKYVESDPIGLDGGINTYGYVGQNTIQRDDPVGEAWQAPMLFCARFPRICAGMAQCFRNPAACRARFCRAGNRLYHPLCDAPQCRLGEGCATTSFKLSLFEGCYANPLAVSWFCNKRPDPQHERERAIAWQKGQECIALLPRNCAGCIPGSPHDVHLGSCG